MKIQLIFISLFIPLIVFSCDKQNSAQDQHPAADSVANKRYPSDILHLKNWKLTLPVDTEHNGSPDEIKQPELESYTSQFFSLNARKDAVVFKAFTGGETTKGSNYPRSELREMSADGRQPASWSSVSGRHILYIDQKVTHLPDVRKHIVIGQIHDASRYTIFFRLEGSKLLISVNKGEKIVLDANYVLGTRFSVMFDVADGQTKCFYNGKLVYLHKEKFEGAYFKVGAYVQSSCKGDKKVIGESCDSYGAVEVFNTWVKHE